MKLFSWLKRNAEALIGAIVISVVVFAIPMAFAFLKPDRMFEAGILAVAVFALLLTIWVLIFLRREIEAHTRPFISVHNIESSASLSQDLTHFILDRLSINIQNTGPVPARDLKIQVCLRQSDSKQIAWQEEKNLLSCAPNTQLSLDFYELEPPGIHPALSRGKMTLEIRISYKGIDTNHQTRQTYKVQPSGMPLAAPNFTVFVFQPVDPTSFS